VSLRNVFWFLWTFRDSVSVTSSNVKTSSWAPWPLKMRQLRCPETSAKNNITLLNDPKERRPQIHRGESLKSRNLTLKFDEVINTTSAMCFSAMWLRFENVLGVRKAEALNCMGFYFVCYKAGKHATEPNRSETKSIEIFGWWRMLQRDLPKEVEKNKVPNGFVTYKNKEYLMNTSFSCWRNIKKVKWSRYRTGVAQRMGRVIALIFHDRDTRRGWVVSSTPRPHFTPGKDPVHISQEAGWAPGPVWTCGKSRPHRDSIPDRPARSQSLYRLSYPAHADII